MHREGMADGMPSGINTDGKSSNCSDPKAVWDCESRLYDSFELRAFLQQLGVAMAAVTTLKSHSPYHMRSPLYHMRSPLHHAGCLANLAFPRKKKSGKMKIRGAHRQQQTEMADRRTVWTRTDLEIAQRAENPASPCKFQPGSPKKRGTRFPRLLQRLLKPFRRRP